MGNDPVKLGIDVQGLRLWPASAGAPDAFEKMDFNNGPRVK